MNEYLEIFLEDMDNNLTLISNSIIELEKDPSNKHAIEEIFRAAHSIKGASASMGFMDIKEVTHKLEDLFDDIRKGKKEVDKNIVAVVLKAIDCLEKLKDKINDENIEVDFENMIKELINIREGKNEDSSIEHEEIIEEGIEECCTSLPINSFDHEISEEVKNLIEEGNRDGYNCYRVSVFLAKDCLLKSVRYFMVHERLNEVGEIIKMIPTPDKVEKNEFDGLNVVFYVLTKYNADYINNKVMEVLEIDRVDIEHIELKQEQQKEQEEQEKTDNKDKENKNKTEINNKQNNNTTSSHIRVNVKTFDNLINLQGELLTENNKLKLYIDKLRENKNINIDIIKELESIVTNIGKYLNNQQEIIMSTRMFPIEQLFVKFPKMVKQLSLDLNKEVNLVIEGQDTELDRTILEKVSDPLIHIIRNAVDHGIERPEERIKVGKPTQGTVKISAKQENGMVIIIVEDDGRGIDEEKIKKKALEKGIYTEEKLNNMSKEEIINLIFLPAFSTADKITDVSGRGVGMDIVKNSLDSIGGYVSIETEKGKGTKFIVKIPLTLAIARALLSKIDNELYVILLNFIKEIIEIERKDIKIVNGAEVFVLRGNSYPIIYLRDIFGYKHIEKEIEKVVLVSNNEKSLALVVDDFIGEQEIVIKSLSKHLYSPSYVTGVTKLGDGRIPIIIDVLGILNNYGRREDKK